MTAKLSPAGPIGEYLVEWDGEQIGRVRKRHEHYRLTSRNGRHDPTYTYWDAYEPDRAGAHGGHVAGPQVARSCDTRREAVAALVAHHLEN